VAPSPRHTRAPSCRVASTAVLFGSAPNSDIGELAGKGARFEEPCDISSHHAFTDSSSLGFRTQVRLATGSAALALAVRAWRAHSAHISTLRDVQFPRGIGFGLGDGLRATPATSDAHAGWWSRTSDPSYRIVGPSLHGASESPRCGVHTVPTRVCSLRLSGRACACGHLELRR
jgi:hypothetical protein